MDQSSQPAGWQRYGGCGVGSSLTAGQTAAKEEQGMMSMVAFIAIGVMGLILVRVRRQRKARTALPR